MPSDQPGALWIFGLLTIEDQGRERLFGGYTRQQQLGKILEQGIAEYDDQAGIFRKATEARAGDFWHTPHGHAVRHQEFIYFTGPFAHTRVLAQADAVKDPAQYESYCFDTATQQWAWKKSTTPTTQQQEQQMRRDGTMKQTSAAYLMQDATGQSINMHGSSIQWNAWRNKWILIGVQSGKKSDPSALGEVWYSESDAITGPWRSAVKIASHPRYTFYNPVQHAFLQREGGKILYFEGTYTKQFSGNTEATMRYDYNQLMYRLDLSDQRLQPARVP